MSPSPYFSLRFFSLPHPEATAAPITPPSTANAVGLLHTDQAGATPDMSADKNKPPNIPIPIPMSNRMYPSSSQYVLSLRLRFAEEFVKEQRVKRTRSYRMYLVTAEQMRALDSTAINEYGIPGVVLMENAGRTTFEVLKRRLGGSVQGVSVVVVAGPGNNGGDGYVIARYLINHGADVETFLLTSREKIRGDAAINLRILEQMTSRVYELQDVNAIQIAASSWQEKDIVVDAILGTGVQSNVRSPYREAIGEINGCPGIRVAVDLPSGLDADTGHALGCAVEADITVTYGFMKLGMALYPGLTYCGDIYVVDISIPLPAMEQILPGAILVYAPNLAPLHRLRSDPQAHKGTFGHVLIVGGSPGKTGAPVMAARAASRIGAGLVTAAVPVSLNPILEMKLTEEMTEPLPEDPAGHFCEASASRVITLAEGKNCVVLGPGMGVSEGSTKVVRRVLAEYSGWVVLDADGLNVLASDLNMLRNAKARVILTPHPGEMGRLLGKKSSAVQEERVQCARQLATEYRVWVVLKGARSLTASPDGFLYVNTTGNSWMASGGQGDVLSGILGGLLTQGIAPEEAIPLGVYLHGLAADNVVARVGAAPVVAGDVIEELPRTLATGEIHRGNQDSEDGILWESVPREIRCCSTCDEDGRFPPQS